MFVKHQCPPSPTYIVWTIGLTFDLDLWPTDLSINRDHLLNKDYLPTKFEASDRGKSFLSYLSHKVWETGVTSVHIITTNHRKSPQITANHHKSTTNHHKSPQINEVFIILHIIIKICFNI